MMNATNMFRCFSRTRSPAIVCLFVLGPLLFAGAAVAEAPRAPVVLPPIEAFTAGEILSYEISWSNIVTAGKAVMEVKSELLPNGQQVFKFTATTRSAGLVHAFYKVNDRLESVFDPLMRQSLKFSLNESHNKKKRRRELVFDHKTKTVISIRNDNPPETLAIPELVQDALSSLYYLRTRDDFVIGKVIIIPVHDSGKNWSVEVMPLCREKVKTPAGEFATIKVRTFPKYEGVFMNKGEIYLWLTDDGRKIPVLMKSTISIGAIVSTLTKVEPGKDVQDGDKEASSKLSPASRR